MAINGERYLIYSVMYRKSIIFKITTVMLCMTVLAFMALPETATARRYYRYGTTCGVTRWSVKTLQDTATPRLPKNPTATSVEALDAKRSQFGAASRIAPTETTLWQIHATLVGYKIESDSDYHLVLRSPNSALTLIGEVPAPYCSGRYASVFGSVRSAVDRIGHHQATRRWWWLDYHGATPPLVLVTGYGYFDYEHAQTGAAPNDVEIHPVTSIQLMR